MYVCMLESLNIMSIPIVEIKSNLGCVKHNYFVCLQSQYHVNANTIKQLCCLKYNYFVGFQLSVSLNIIPMPTLDIIYKLGCVNRYHIIFKCLISTKWQIKLIWKLLTLQEAIKLPCVHGLHDQEKPPTHDITNQLDNVCVRKNHACD